MTDNRKDVLLFGTMSDKDRLLSQNPVREYFEAYRKGKYRMDEIVKRIMLGQRNADRNILPVLPCLSGPYESVKDRIFFRVINAEKNKELLQDVVHEKVLDLAMVCCTVVGQTDQGMQSCMIRNHLAGQWGIEPSVIMEDAKKNTEAMFPAVKHTMDTLVREILERRGMEDEEREYFEPVPTESGPLPYILTTMTGINGFQAVFYPDSLREIAEEWGTDLYILPSSIHEALILPGEKDGKHLDELLRTVSEVNQECVSPEEYLSDSVYYYDCLKEEIRIAGKTERFRIEDRQRMTGTFGA